MKFTLLVTQRCNLGYEYCYVGKRPGRMSLDLAQEIVHFACRNTPLNETLEVGFFGGEPLLEFERIREITHRSGAANRGRSTRRPGAADPGRCPLRAGRDHPATARPSARRGLRGPALQRSPADSRPRASV